MAGSGDILLQARDLERRDGGLIRVRDLDLVLRQGEIMGLLGINGAGKSTTLALLSGALRPTRGRVEVLGFDLHRRPREAKRHLGLLPESPPLYPNLTVDENLDFAARLRGLAGRAVPQAREQVKRQLELGGFGRRLCSRLSKGMAQRVGIAQSIIHQPEVLILDEPTAGLDPAQARELRQLVMALRGSCAVLLATHILRDVEVLCDRVSILREGRLVTHESLQHQHVRVHLQRPPGAARLAGLTGVRAVHPAADGWFDLELEEVDTELARRIALHDWGLDAFIPGRHDLERLLGLLVGVDDEAA